MLTYLLFPLIPWSPWVKPIGFQQNLSVHLYWHLSVRVVVNFKCTKILRYHFMVYLSNLILFSGRIFPIAVFGYQLAQRFNGLLLGNSCFHHLTAFV